MDCWRGKAGVRHESDKAGTYTSILALLPNIILPNQNTPTRRDDRSDRA